MESISPKVFICHATEDKERFVESFAKELRNNGIDAWYDDWEILVGDSLVKKIFEEGLKNADAMVVILSPVSIQKKWVNEELSIGVVKRIEEDTKLIPIIIEECKIPESLKSTRWIKIKDINSYEKELIEISSSIFGRYEKPPLGEANQKLEVISSSIFTELSTIDKIVLNELCTITFDKLTKYIVINDKLIEKFRERGIAEDELNESLLYLEGEGYLKNIKVSSNQVVNSSLTYSAFDIYLNSRINYNDLLYSIINEISHKVPQDADGLAAKLNISSMIANHFIEKLTWEDCIQSTQVSSGDYIVLQIKPKLKRVYQ